MRVTLIATLVALVTAAPAAAHVGVKSYSPKRGERVAWTGAPDSDSPAPRVTLHAPEPERP